MKTESVKMPGLRKTETLDLLQEAWKTLHAKLKEKEDWRKKSRGASFVRLCYAAGRSWSSD